MVSPAEHQENLRAALIAASAQWPEAYKIRQFATLTSEQTMQAVTERAAALAAWLDAQQDGHDVRVALTAERLADRIDSPPAATPSPGIPSAGAPKSQAYQDMWNQR